MHVTTTSAQPQRTSTSGFRLLARTVRGIEWIAAAEISATFNTSRLERGHREIRFSLDELTPSLLDLGTADDVFLVAATADSIGHRRRDLEQLARASVAIDLDSLAIAIAVAGPVARSRTFDVTASFLGHRNYNRYELEDALGKTLATRSGWGYYPRARGRPSAHDGLSLRIHLVGSEATVAVRIGRNPLRRRRYRVATRPGSLHPPLARALALLAGLRPAQLLVDPFCGVGTIPIEAKLASPGVHVTGLDVDGDAVASVRANARRAGVRASFLHADAAALPFAMSTVDRVVTNGPWGSAVAPVGRLARAPDAAWREVARVLKPGGRVVVLLPVGAHPLGFPSGHLAFATRVRVAGALADALVLTHESEGREVDEQGLFGSELESELPPGVPTSG